MQQKSNTAYKWRKIFAVKAYGGKEIKLTPIEAQELIDDIESEVKSSLGDVSKNTGALHTCECNEPDAVNVKICLECDGVTH